MKNSILLSVIILLIVLSSMVTAVTDYEAESQYKTALTYFQGNDFRNTLRSAHLAKNLFQAMNNQAGIDKSNRLITQVNELLNDAQMAGAYYDIASDYYLHDTTLSSLTSAKEFAQYASEYYNRAGDADGVLMSEDLVRSVQTEINSRMSEKMAQAETFYQTARQKYLNGDYLQARTLAINASIIFNEILDQSGISKTASLVVNIDADINKTRFNAVASYDRALDYYSQKNCSNAARYAAVSQQLYTKIGDLDGMVRATNLVSRINSECARMDDELMKEAELYYNKAEDSLIMEQYSNATDYAKMARNIYNTFYTKAYAEEKDLPDSQQVRMKFYRSYLIKVDNLLGTINSRWSREERLKQAESFYNISQFFYVTNQLEFSMNYAERAKSYFTDLNEYLGVAKCESLISSINAKMENKRQADDYYEKAVSFFNTAEFENALLYAEKAREIYVEIVDQPNTLKVQNFTQAANDGIKFRNEADAYQTQAGGYFNVGDYENAKQYSKKAHLIYLQINFTIGSINSEQILNRSNEKINENYVQFRNNALIAAGVILLGGFLILQRLGQQRQVETEIKKEKQRIEEDTKMLHKEMAVKTEKETKERVEDELRRLVEQEREQMGGDSKPK